MALVEASIEGRIQPLSVVGFGSGGVQLKAMGITIQFLPGNATDPYATSAPPVPRRRTITTPAGEITVGQLLDQTPLPGRTAKGFEGGTIIAEGFFETNTKVLHANFLTVEPGETVVLGALTRNDPGAGGAQRLLEVNGMPVEMLTDPRLPSDPAALSAPVYLNQYGFPMRIETATLSPTGPNPATAPAPSSVEGYFSEKGENTFYAFLFEFGGTGTLLTDPVTTPQVVIERVEYRDRGAQVEYDARGAVTTFHQNPASPFGQDVELFRIDHDPSTNTDVETSLGRATIETREPGFERWRFRDRPAKPGGFRAGVPLRFRVKNISGVVPATGKPAEHQKEPDRVREA